MFPSERSRAPVPHLKVRLRAMEGRSELAARIPMLSKSRFVTGCQCHKLLWWTVHEPDATELQPDKVLQDLFDQGRQVGELARTRFPGGVLIEAPQSARPQRVAQTRAARESGVPAVFEPTFAPDHAYAPLHVPASRG